MLFIPITVPFYSQKHASTLFLPFFVFVDKWVIVVDLFFFFLVGSVKEDIGLVYVFFLLSLLFFFFYFSPSPSAASV